MTIKPTININDFPYCCGVGVFTNFFRAYTKPKETHDANIEFIGGTISNKKGARNGAYMICLNERQKEEWHGDLVNKLGFTCIAEDIPNPVHSNETFVSIYLFLAEGRKK